MTDILQTAYRERDRLRAELARIPCWQMLQQVQKLIDVYESAKTSAPVRKNLPINRGEYQAPRPGSKIAAVVEVVTNHLNETGKRATSGDLLPIVSEAGIVMTGKIPAKSLSALLSPSKRFNNVPGLGYGLSEWGYGDGRGAPSEVGPGEELSA